MLGWVQDVPLQIDALKFFKFKQRYVKMEHKQKFNQLFPFEI